MASNPRPTKRTRRSVSQQAGPSNVSAAGPPTLSGANEGSGHGPQPGAFEQGSDAWSHDYNPVAEAPTHDASGYGIYAASAAQPSAINNTAPHPMNDCGAPNQAGYPPSNNEHELQYQAQPTHGSSLSLQQPLMLDPRGPYAIPQGLPHIFIAGASAQIQGVPAAYSTTSSIIDPSLLQAAEPWSHLPAQSVPDSVGNDASGPTSCKRKARDEDTDAAGEDSGVLAAATRDQGQIDLILSFLKGKCRVRDEGAGAADGAGLSAPQSGPVSALPDQGQVNTVDEKKPKTKAEKAQDSRNTKGDQKLVINGELCSDHKVYIKPGTKNIPEKKIFEGAIACLRQLKWERVRARAEFDRERALFGANHLSVVDALMKVLEGKEKECEEFRSNEHKLLNKIATLEDEVRRLTNL